MHRWKRGGTVFAAAAIVLHAGVALAQLQTDIVTGARTLPTLLLYGGIEVPEPAAAELNDMVCVEHMLGSGGYPAVEEAFLANQSIAEEAMGSEVFDTAPWGPSLVAFYATQGLPGSPAAQKAHEVLKSINRFLRGPGFSGDFDSSQAVVAAEYIHRCSLVFDDADDGSREVGPIGGTIVDENGNPFDPRLCLWLGGRAWSGSLSSDRGTFYWDDFPVIPSTLEFFHPGYQGKVLVHGRDYDMGDLDIRVQLVPGPFPKYQSIFKAVTGYDYAERGRIPRVDRYLQKIGQYRKTAGNDEGAWLHVLGPDAKPIDALTVVQWWNPRLSLPDTRLQEEQRVTTLAGENGNYTIPFPPVYVRAPGLGGRWFSPDRKQPWVEVHELVLSPAARLRLTVNTADGQARAGVYVTVSAKTKERQRMRNAVNPWLPTPRTDDLGTVEFPNLAPGTYSIWATDSGGHATSLEVSVEAGETTESAITL